MPTELRKVILTAEETLRAIQSYARMVPRFLPRGEVHGFHLDEAAEDGVGLMVSAEAENGDTTVLIQVEPKPAEVIEILVRCCLENNIPIPRLGTKRAVLVEGMLALSIRYESHLPYEA